MRKQTDQFKLIKQYLILTNRFIYTKDTHE
nr:MAG TPA: hypothetical protein [Caudoviricetes sp.]DAS61520.1 MAG TPA: hypothetical protein [Caudoviricetes sp.]